MITPEDRTIGRKFVFRKYTNEKFHCNKKMMEIKDYTGKMADKVKEAWRQISDLGDDSPAIDPETWLNYIIDSDTSERERRRNKEERRAQN